MSTVIRTLVRIDIFGFCADHGPLMQASLGTITSTVTTTSTANAAIRTGL